jgi:hypothetical protein
VISEGESFKVAGAMWTELSVRCQRCDCDIPVRVQATNPGLMEEAGRNLSFLLLKHLERDHA